MGRNNEIMWTEGEVKVLTELWGQHTSTEIGERLGRSRNSIIGKAKRLRLTEKGGHKKGGPKRLKLPAGLKKMKREMSGGTKARINSVRIRSKFSPQPPRRPHRTPIMDLTESYHRNLKIVDLGSHHCRWIIGSTHGAETVYCGDDAETTSWCEFHQQKVFRLASA